MIFRFTLSHTSDTRARVQTLSSFVNMGSGTTWTTGSNPSVTVVQSSGSKLLVGQLTNASAGAYAIELDFDIVQNSGSTNVVVLIELLDSGFNVIDSDSQVYITQGHKVLNVNLTAATAPVYVSISIDNNTILSSSATIDINSIEVDSGSLETTSQEISEPDGWKEAKIILERHKDFFSIIEYYDGGAGGGFIFYGNDGQVDGGINFIRQVEENYGFDASIVFTVEYARNDIDFTTIFEGQLDLSAKNEMPDNKMQVPVIRDGFWSKFVNRFETPVNLSSDLDLDGNPVDPAQPVTINLTNQKLKRTYDAWFGNETVEGQNFQLDYVEYNIPGNQYGQIDFDNAVLDEIDEKVFLPRLDNPDIPAGLFVLEYGGDYAVDLWLAVSTTPLGVLGSSVADLEIRIQVNNDAAVTATKTNTGTNGINGATLFTYTDTLSNLQPGDQIKIYFENTDGSPNNFFCNGGYLRVEGATVFPDTQAEGYLIHDLIHAALARMGLGTDPLYSEFLGSTNTLSRSYAEDGCGWNYIILKGLQIRGYTLSEKPFFISMRDIWEGINPILCLGLGYETIDDTPDRQVIRIEPKSHFVEDVASVNFSNIRDITTSYDGEMIFKTIKSGYRKWESNDSAGLDETQSKRTFAGPFGPSGGKEITIESGFIAGCWVIEKTRRTIKKKSADNQYDNDNFIISVVPDDISPQVMEPELQGGSLLITDADSPETRYNIRLTATRNIYRWLDYLSGCMQPYQSLRFKFVRGEGNYTAYTEIDDNCPGDNDGVGFIESSDIIPSSDSLVFPMKCNINAPVDQDDFETLRSNLKQAIGISQTLSGFHNVFITRMEYQIVTGQGSIVGWPKEFFTLQVVEQEFSMACETPAPPETFTVCYQNLLDYAETV